MSTRSHIGILNQDGTVREIYHHWDGYLEGVGKVLVNNYTTEEKINKLLDLGDMSIIGKEPIGYWDNYGNDENKCMTYRERGEDDVDARTHSSIDAYLDYADEDYTYLFKDGQWYYCCWDDRDLRLVKNEISTKSGEKI